MADERSFVPQFTGESYSVWAFGLQHGLLEKDLLPVVCDFDDVKREVCPTLLQPYTQEEIASIASAARNDAVTVRNAEVVARAALNVAWKRKDQKARAYFVKHLHPDEYVHVRTCKHAHEMWDALVKVYAKRGEIEIANANAQLSAIVMGESEDLTDFVKRLQVLHMKLEQLGEPVSATKQASNLLNCLSTRYSGVVRNIQSWSLICPSMYTIPDIMSNLIAMDVREDINARKRGEPAMTDVSGGGRVNYGGAGPSLYQQGDQRKGSGSNSAREIICYRCNAKGHVKAQCPKNGADLGNLKCHACDRFGHKARDCKRPKAGFQNGGKDVKSRFCEYCKEKGSHTEEFCKLKKSDVGAAARMAARSGFDATHASSYTAFSGALSAGTHATPKAPILDSGATDHIWPDRQDLAEYSTNVPLPSSFIYTADNKAHLVKGVGVVTLEFSNGMSARTVRLQVLHVPSLGERLVSMDCLNKRGGVAFHLSEKGVPMLTKGGGNWVDVKRASNGLLLMPGKVLPPAHPRVNLSVGMSMHQKLGHPGLTLMQVLAGNGTISALSEAEVREIRECEVCCQGKMAQLPHARIVEERGGVQVMDKMHLDLVGPMAVKSMNGGYTYVQTGIEVASRLSFVSLLKNKSEALKVSKVLIKSLEVESGKPLKILRTDGGGEYASQEWKDFAGESGLTHELTAPYSPEQNGMVERLNRTLLEKMRCMLISSGLPKSYWDVAIVYASWLRNRLPTSSLQGRMPIEVWKGSEERGLEIMGGCNRC